MKKVLSIFSIILMVSIIPLSFGWDGQMALDADKRNVNYGEVILYQGYIYGDNLIADEPVYIIISEQESGEIILEKNTIPDSTLVEYFENIAWSFTFEIDTDHQDFNDDMKYVVEAKYDDKSTKLDFFIKEGTKVDLKEKAADAGEAIVEAGTETGELVVEAGKEAGEVIVEKGKEAGEVIVEKGKESGEVIVETGKDVIDKVKELDEQNRAERQEFADNLGEKGSEVIEEIKDTGGGCLIATAAYGTEMAPQVQFLREIRDNTVMSTESGTAFLSGFNQVYYIFSPTIADFERENPVFQEVVRFFITPMISSLAIMTLAENENENQVFGLGVVVIILNLAMYIVAPIVISLSIHRKLKPKIHNFSILNRSSKLSRD